MTLFTVLYYEHLVDGTHANLSFFIKDPKDAMDPKLKALRDARGYSYADIITIHPDHLPGFEDKIKAFFEEHIHDAEEIRYILGGSGYFDVRNCE